MKKKLQALLAKKKEARDAKANLSATMDNVEELRSVMAEVEAMNVEIRSLEEMINGMEDEPTNERTAAVNSAIPGIVVAGMPGEGRKAINEVEERAVKFAETGKFVVDSAETRAVLLDTDTLATPTSVAGIHEPMNTVSSIVDMVLVEDLTGVGSHKEAYMKSWQAAKDNVSLGTAPDASDPVFRTVTINPFPMDVLTYVGKNIRKQTPVAYAEKVKKGALVALRKKVASWIINGNGTYQAFGIYNAVNTETSPEALADALLVDKAYAIGADTLRKIVFAYGGDENVVGAGARLFLNKTDLIAFGDVRGTNEKKSVYEITPDGANPNTGIIKDGGLSVPYVICSDVTALTGSATTGAARIKTMIYGDPYAYKLGLFGNYEISVSEDYKFAEGLLAVKGEVMVGGNIIVDKGFVIVTKKDTTD